MNVVPPSGEIVDYVQRRRMRGKIEKKSTVSTFADAKKPINITQYARQVNDGDKNTYYYKLNTIVPKLYQTRGGQPNGKVLADLTFEGLVKNVPANGAGFRKLQAAELENPGRYIPPQASTESAKLVNDTKTRLRQFFNQPVETPEEGMGKEDEFNQAVEEVQQTNPETVQEPMMLLQQMDMESDIFTKFPELLQALQIVSSMRNQDAYQFAGMVGKQLSDLALFSETQFQMDGFDEQLTVTDKILQYAEMFKEIALSEVSPYRIQPGQYAQLAQQKIQEMLQMAENSNQATQFALLDDVMKTLSKSLTIGETVVTPPTMGMSVPLTGNARARDSVSRRGYAQRIDLK
jgi:hypothetical protein